jgi:molybdopterin/thiamine biosynthesis adenylyltransferase
MNLTNEHLTRQLDLIPTSVLGEPITIIGAGAIGSFATLSLAKMGFTNITVFDYDTVDVVNMNSQFYRFKDIGRTKVAALEDLVHEFTGVRIKTGVFKYAGGQVFPGIVVSAVDSMEARKLIWEAHKERGFRTKLIIDPRMSAEFCALYAASPMDRETKYGNSLFDDKDAVQERCTAKATMYTVGPIAGLVAKVVKEFLTEGTYTKTIQWDLKANHFQGWRTKGVE